MGKFETIIEKCNANNLQTRIISKETQIISKDIIEIKYKDLVISIPKREEFKDINISDISKDLEIIEKSDFEKFKFINGFQAIWSEELNIIECGLESNDYLRSPKFYMLKLLPNMTFYEVIKIGNRELIEFPSPNEKIKIYIGDSTIEYAILTKLVRESPVNLDMLDDKTTIRIEGIKIENHDEARLQLLKIANSILFQIDNELDIPLYLSPEYYIMKDYKFRYKDEIKFRSPIFDYDDKTMSLYWYARTSKTMPLLQFLSFYQILEYYFPLFSNADAKQKIKNFIRDPTFNIERDKDISKIINIIKLTSYGKSFNNEINQLKVTIQNIIDTESLVEFLTENKKRKDFFEKPKKGNSLSKYQLPLTNPGQDIREGVSKRIYEIRCKIVHTKEDGDNELLLPFSIDIVHLKYDLELIEFLARKALIATRRTMKL